MAANFLRNGFPRFFFVFHIDPGREEGSFVGFDVRLFIMNPQHMIVPQILKVVSQAFDSNYQP
jgi:hypothetical protein